MRSRLFTWLLAAALLATAAVPVLAAPGWLGVSTQSTDADLRRGLDLTRDGLLVSRVFADSPAERAGVQKGDVILRFDGHSVTAPEELRDAVRDAGSGRSAKLELWRNGTSRTLDVRLVELPTNEQDLDEMPVPPAPPSPRAAPAPDRSSAPELRRVAPPAPPAAPDPDERIVRRKVYVNGRALTDEEIDDKLKELHIEGLGDWSELKELKELQELKGLKGMHVWTDDKAPTPWGGARGHLGVRVEKLSPELGEALGVTGGKGVVVLEVIEETPAQKAGLRAGDVIVEVAGHAVNDRDDLVNTLHDREGRVDIVLTRKGSRRTVQVDLPAGRESFNWNRGPAPRGFSMRIPEPGRAPRVYRYQTDRDGGGGDAALRLEMDQLKQELRELKELVGEQQHEQQKAKPPVKAKTPAPTKK